MKIDSKYKIQLAVSTDELRPAMMHILIDGDRAIATDGHILASVPIVKEADEPDGTVSTDVLKLITKRDNINSTLLHEMVNIQNKNHTITCSRRNDDSPYPNYKTVLVENTDGFEIALNINLLKDLADALGNGILRLRFGKDNTSTVYVRPYERDNTAFGMIAPVRIIDEVSHQS